MDGSLTTGVHEEFARRVDEHFDRIDARLNVIDEELKSYRDLAMDIQRIGLNTEKMCDEMKNQSTRLKALEDRDGEKWRTTATTVLTVIIGAVVGYMLTFAGIVA